MRQYICTCFANILSLFYPDFRQSQSFFGLSNPFIILNLIILFLFCTGFNLLSSLLSIKKLCSLARHINDFFVSGAQKVFSLKSMEKIQKTTLRKDVYSSCQPYNPENLIRGEMDEENCLDQLIVCACA